MSSERSRLKSVRSSKDGSLIKGPSLLDLTDFKRDLSELTDRLGNAQDCL